jgi:hypothetical protein
MRLGPSLTAEAAVDGNVSTKGQQVLQDVR